MKSLTLFMLSFLSLIAVTTHAQTVDEIVDNYVTAMGGKEKFTSLNTVILTGTLSTQGIEIPITITKHHNVGVRTDLEIMGTSNYQVCNAMEGWAFFPIRQMSEPAKMTDEEYKSYSGQLDLQGPLFNYKEKGNTIEFLGKDKVDGAEAYKLKVALKSGKTSTYYIDTKTHFVIKIASVAVVNGQDMEIENSFSDFKQTADGYWFPYTSTNMQGPVTFSKIETNVKVDDSIFKN
jgi:hypothetical protein